MGSQEFTTTKSIFRVKSLSLNINFTCKSVVIIFSVYHSEVSFDQWGFILFHIGIELLTFKCPRSATVDMLTFFLLKHYLNRHAFSAF